MDAQKKQMLEDEGYSFDQESRCFINRKSGKIFSQAWVEEKNFNTLQITLAVPHDPVAWKFYLNPDQPHLEIRTALSEKYGKRP